VLDARGHAACPRFALAVRDIYLRPKDELGYNATYFLRMLSTKGAVQAARRLITSSHPSEGFTTLRERRRLDPTVEAHAIQPRFRSLFTESQLDAARQRLEKLRLFNRVMMFPEKAAERGSMLRERLITFRWGRRAQRSERCSTPRI